MTKLGLEQLADRDLLAADLVGLVIESTPASYRQAIIHEIHLLGAQRTETVDKDEKITINGNRTELFLPYVEQDNIYKQFASKHDVDFAFADGVYVAAGDINGDGFTDI